MLNWLRPIFQNFCHHFRGFQVLMQIAANMIRWNRCIACDSKYEEIKRRPSKIIMICTIK